MRQFRNLLFAARTIVEGVYTGRHKSPFQGASQEFVDYREYAPGDEIRSIDWKAYARTDRYFIKLFEKETDMACYLLVDCSASMAFGGTTYRQYPRAGVLSKFEYACFLAAAPCYLTVRQGDKVGLTLFDRQVRAHLPTGGTFSHLYRLLNVLERVEPGRTTSIARVLRETFPLFRRKGILVVISDLLDEPEAIFEALSMYRHRGFEVILLQVLHPWELHLPELPNVNFVDSETTERITSAPADIRESYRTLLAAFLEALESGARARRIDHQLIDTETPYYVALEQYMRKRSHR